MKSLQLSKPHLLVVVGIPGAGKSYFALQFSHTFNAPYVDFGHFRRAVNNFDIGTKLANYSLGQLLKTKQTIVIEGRGATRADRKKLVSASRKYGYDVVYIWVQTDADASERRAVRSKTATIAKEDYDRQVKEFQPLGESEEWVVISGKHTYASQARAVLKKLTMPRREIAVPVASRVISSRGRIME